MRRNEGKRRRGVVGFGELEFIRAERKRDLERRGGEQEELRARATLMYFK
jgi:hypothetical protein